MPMLTRKTHVSDEYLQLVRRFPLAPIRTRQQLQRAHAMIDELTKIPENRLTSAQEDYLEVLGDLTSKFEEAEMTAQLKDLAGIDLLRHLLEANEMTASDLGRLLGQRELGSKILRGDRHISRTHARILGEQFGLPPETFLR